MEFPTPIEFMSLLHSNDPSVASCVHSIVSTAASMKFNVSLSYVLCQAYVVYCGYASGYSDNESLKVFRSKWIELNSGEGAFFKP